MPPGPPDASNNFGILRVAAAVAYVATRYVMFFVATATVMTDINIYAKYAWEYQTARARGQPFYEFHRAQLEKAQAQHGLDPKASEYSAVEYPPLAVQFMRWPTLFLTVPTSAPECPQRFEAKYWVVYRFGMLFIDATLFIFVFIQSGRLFPADTFWERSARVFTYLVSSALCWVFLFDRLDLIVALASFLTVVLVIRGRVVLAYALLACAVGFKLTPAVLIPIVAVATIPAAAVGAWRKGRRAALVWAAGWRLLVLSALGALALTGWAALDGPASVRFFDFHRERGVEIGSVPGSIIMLLGRLGSEVTVYHSNYSVNIRSAVGPIVQSTTATAGLIGMAGATFLTWRRLIRFDEPGSRPGQRLAEVNAGEVLRGSLLLFLIFIAANKVFSPQYLIWLLPFAALWPGRGRRLALVLAVFVTLCGLTGLIYWKFFWTDLTAVITRPPEHDWSFGQPTPRGIFVLAARNLCLLILIPLVAFLRIERTEAK
jgi:hypothetical protein